MNSLTKKRRAWAAGLKRKWQALGLWDHCWSCGTSSGLTVMHARKVRFLTTQEEYERAARVCFDEHRLYEEGNSQFRTSHEKMAAFVDSLRSKTLKNGDQ